MYSAHCNSHACVSGIHVLISSYENFLNLLNIFLYYDEPDLLILENETVLLL